MGRPRARKGSGSGTAASRAAPAGETQSRSVSHAVDAYGTIDWLVNNAGYHPPTRRIDDFTAEEFRDVLNVNLVSYFTTCQLALPYLRKSKGSIVNISSLVGEMGQETIPRQRARPRPTLSPPYPSSLITKFGVWLAWDSMATPACCSTLFFETADDSSAMSVSLIWLIALP